MSLQKRNAILSFVALSLLLGFDGCDWRGWWTSLSSKSSPLAKQVQSGGSDYASGGKVIVEAFGKPYVAQEPFERKLEQMLKASPYTRGMDIASLPGEAKLNFLRDWVKFLLIQDVWGKENRVEEREEFQQKFRESCEALKGSLIIEEFVKELRGKISVSDSDVKKEYEANRERYMKAPAGTHIVTMRCKDRVDAEKLHKLARSKNSSVTELEEASSELEGVSFANHGFVGGDMYAMAALASLPAEVQDSILKSDAPRSALVTAGEDSWVVCALEKRKAEYYELADIRDQIRAGLEESLQRDLVDQRIEEFSRQADLKINEELFKGSQDNVRVVTPEELSRAVKSAEEVAEQAQN